MTAVAARGFPGTPRTVRRDLAIGAAVVGAVAASFALAPISHASLEAARLEAAGRLVEAGIPAAVGLYAWRRTPFGRIGALLVASGVVWLIVTFSLSDQAIIYSIGRVAEWVGWAVILYLVLAFPEGRLRDPLDRMLGVITGVIFALLWLPTALLLERYPTPVEWVRCSGSCPRNAFLVLGHEPAVIAHVVVPARELLTAALFLAIVGRLIQRIHRASRIRRRTLTLVLGVAVVVLVVRAGGLLLRRVEPESSALHVAAWLTAFALPVMALGFLAGLMRWRLYVGASLRRFAASLSLPGVPDRVRAGFAGAFADPTLAIVYPVGDGRWAEADGRPADAPVAGNGRSVTDLRADGGDVVAALIHDEALEGEAAFINAVGAYATLSLENHRLAAEVASLAREMRQTQARAAASADRTREEIERDLHDGAQQRLIALRIKLQVAAERAGDPAARTAEELDQLGAEVQLAIDEMRTMAHGLFPSALAGFGPVEELCETARSAPIPTAVNGANVGRYSAAIERAVYFCCLEALQNVYKHARTATAAQVTIALRGRHLAFEVADNGAGFDPAAITTGAGLQNMLDRVASVGGSLTIDTAPERGTRVTGAIPVVNSHTGV